MNVIWLIGLFYLSAEAINPYPHINENEKKKWCGPHLPDIMALICRGSYREFFRTSKKDPRCKYIFL